MPFSSRERFGVPDHESWNNTPSVTVDQVTIFLLLSTGCTEPLLGGLLVIVIHFSILVFWERHQDMLFDVRNQFVSARIYFFLTVPIIGSSYLFSMRIQIRILVQTFAKLIAEKISKRCIAGSLCNNFENLMTRELPTPETKKSLKAKLSKFIHDSTQNPRNRNC